MKYGFIGPASQLLPKSEKLSKILPTLDKITLDGKRIKDPVFAVSTSQFDEFIGEIEALAFLSASDRESHAEEEIFGHKIRFTFCKENGEEVVCIDEHMKVRPPEAVDSIQLQDFPKGFHRWDVSKISEFEPFLEKTLQGGLYTAIVECLSGSEDKELRREKRRIIVSITLFNQVHVHLALTQPFSSIGVILLAAALEALLDLPSETINTSFQHTVATLLGEKTSLLKKWCREFYEYRSALVHGDISFGSEEKTFNSIDEPRPHSIIASAVFIHCLKTRLFLMGLLPEYHREEFSFEGL